MAANRLKEAARRVIPSEVIDRKSAITRLKHLQAILELGARSCCWTRSQDRGLLNPAMLDRLLNTCKH